MLEFARCSAFAQLAQGGLYHRALSGKHLRKEVSETWAIVKAAQVFLTWA